MEEQTLEERFFLECLNGLTGRDGFWFWRKILALLVFGEDNPSSETFPVPIILF